MTSGYTTIFGANTNYSGTWRITSSAGTGQIKFDGVEPLISQMTDDVDAARKILA